VIRLACLALLVACSRDPAVEQRDEPVVHVTTAAARQGEVATVLTGYGTVAPAPGAALTISRPFELRVATLLVTDGQRVKAGDPLIRFEPSPDTRLRVDVAREASTAAARNLESARHRFALGLATNSDVVAAQQAANQAATERASLGARGADAAGTIDAPKTGTVTVHVQKGALVPAGQALVEIVAENAIEADVGIQLAGAAELHAGDPAHVAAVSRQNVATDGTVRSVARAIDPATRLIPVTVLLSGDLVLGEYVLASFPVAKHQGLLVPRSAVLPDGDQQILFTVDHGHAKRHVVHVGVETRDEIEIVAQDVHAGDRVITVGNYGCTDGAPVRESAR
jgi:membrane fusion protein (multidrug efflux system)